VNVADVVAEVSAHFEDTFGGDKASVVVVVVVVVVAVLVLAVLKAAAPNSIEDQPNCCLVGSENQRITSPLLVEVFDLYNPLLQHHPAADP